jgi:hypothetical protein
MLSVACAAAWRRAKTLEWDEDDQKGVRQRFLVLFVKS